MKNSLEKIWAKTVGDDLYTGPKDFCRRVCTWSMPHSLSLLYSNKHKEETYHVPSRGIAYEKKAVWDYCIFELTW
jgi:hypothetical protein